MVKVYKVSLEEQSLAEWERHWNEILENKIQQYSDDPYVDDSEGLPEQSTIETLLQANGFIRYINRTNRSNVKEYRPGDTYVVIRFKDDSTYLYSNKLLTEAELTYIKDLADSGSGLNSYLNRLIGRRYTARLYRDVVFIQPGLEAFKHSISIPTLSTENFSEAPVIAEKRYIKNLIEILQCNQQLRLKRLTEALGGSSAVLNAVVPLSYLDPAARTLLYSNSKTLLSSLKLLDNFNILLIDTLRKRVKDSLTETVRSVLKEYSDIEYSGGFILDHNLDWIGSIDYNPANLNRSIAPSTFTLSGKLIELTQSSNELVDRLVSTLRKAMFDINQHNSKVLVSDLKTVVTTVDDVNNYLVDLLIALKLGVK